MPHFRRPVTLAKAMYVDNITTCTCKGGHQSNDVVTHHTRHTSDAHILDYKHVRDLGVDTQPVIPAQMSVSITVVGITGGSTITTDTLFTCFFFAKNMCGVGFSEYKVGYLQAENLYSSIE